MKTTNQEPLTIHEAAAQLRAKTCKSADLVAQCLARIASMEPQVKAWVVVDADGARQQAARADQELAAGNDRGP
ncbi:MAG: hypothetical protein AB7O62_05790, partial [Pirellulales bacterium]